jgi:acyl-CoA thioesterase-1
VKAPSKFIGALAAAVLFVFATADAARADTIRLIAFGDSLTAGLGLPAKDAFPAKLEAALKARGHDVTVANAGVSGDTASAGLARLDWSVGADVDGAIVELGANDMLRGVDPSITAQAMDEIVGKFKAKNIEILVAGMMAAPNLGEDYGRAYNAIFPSIAEKYGALFYPFFLDGVAADPKLNQPDGMHPTAAGVDVIVSRILPSVEGLIARIEAKG